jgi:hypothetical protein
MELATRLQQVQLALLSESVVLKKIFGLNKLTFQRFFDGFPHIIFGSIRAASISHNKYYTKLNLNVDF